MPIFDIMTFLKNRREATQDTQESDATYLSQGPFIQCTNGPGSQGLFIQCTNGPGSTRDHVS
jgi:hypothetical protein